MLNRFKICLAMIFVVSCAAACPGPVTVQSDALFRDVAHRPPDAKPETVAALERDEQFGRWVIYQDRLCDRHGCVR